MKKEVNENVAKHALTLRTLALFSISLFLLIALATAFIFIPKVNELMESQHGQDLNHELVLEAALFTRFIETQQSVMDDLATYPNVTSAVMMSDGSERAVNELLNNVVIGGKKSRLVLQDIAANIVIQTDNELTGNYTAEQPWIENILSGTKPYHIELLGQKGFLLTFKMSVPVLYNTSIEGVLSGEITVSLQDVFVTQSLNNKVAFKLVQGDVEINTDMDHIQIIRENSTLLSGSNITFTYVTDDALIQEGKRTLQNTVLIVLLISFVLAFSLFALVGYRSSLGSEQLQHIKNVSWSSYTIPLLVGMVGVSASITAFMIATNVKDAAIEKEFIFESKQRIKAVRQKIDAKLQILDALKSFYKASNHVSRQEFATFVKPLIAMHSNIQAIEWIPKVSFDDRVKYEKQASEDGISNFAFRDKNNEGKLISAKARDNYYPVYYVEPLIGNEKSMGFDLGSNPKRLAALNKAKNSGKLMGSALIKLVQENGAKVGILVFNPIYVNNLNNNNVLQQKEIHGFVLIVLKVENLVADTSSDNQRNLLFYIEDISETDNVEAVYGSEPLNSQFTREETISVGGRNWRIKTYSNSTQQPFLWSSWLILFGGLLFSVFITIGIVQLIRRREIVEALVNRRTIELKQSEEQHRAVVENAVDGLLTIDSKGLIEKFNFAAQRIFGYRLDEVMGKNIKILMPEPYHGEHDGYLSNYHNTGTKKIIGIGRQVEGRRKDGSTFPLDLSVSEMNFGSDKKFSGIVRDITERVALEEERKKFLDKLIDSNEELERFAFVCSHDLQEPLRMVRSFSEKLQDHLSDDLKDDPKGKKYFNFVIDGAARAQTLITDILAYSSISSDTQLLETVNIEDLIKVITNNILNSGENNKGEITFDPLPKLQGNKTQLYQLFQNLINNGLKYQKPDTIPTVHIGVEDEDSHWTFSIKDNGIGMEERHLKKIFDVFQRLHRRSQFAGTGVGLSICKKVVERHDGTIWVESEKNIGSTFYVKLLKPTFLEEK